MGLVKAFLVLVAFGAMVGLGLGLLQAIHPAMDSFSHFRLHFIAVLVIAALPLLLLSRGWFAWLALTSAVVSMGWTSLQIQAAPPAEAPRGALRLVQFNLNFGNQTVGEAARAMAVFDADVVTLQEVTLAHERAMRGLSAYPYQTHCAFRDVIGGVSILSRYPLSGEDCATGEGLVTARMEAPGGAVTVGSIHTYWPWPISQHDQIDRWLPRLRALEGPVILAGDFNAAPWSDAVDKVEAASRAAVVPGLRMTIGVRIRPALPAVPIPIDHVLLSNDLCGLAATVGPQLGSDHYPVIVEIGRVPSKRCGIR